MLVQLSIRDIVLIERLTLEPGGGLSVLTGETGAGKSILLDALSLALGARGDGGLVRAGATQGEVSAVFEPEGGHPVWRVLGDDGIEPEGTLILRRVQGQDGRTRAFINDRPVSATLLRNTGRMLVELHGQHDDRALVDPATHRDLVDAYGGLETDCAATRAAHANWRRAEADIAALRQRLAAGEREAEYLRAAVAELSKLSPQIGEEEQLAETRSRLMRHEKMAAEVAEAAEILNGAASPAPTLANLLRRLERKAGDAAGLFDETIAQLDAGLNGLFAAQQAIDRAVRQTGRDPAELERAEERLFALRAAARKFGKPVDGLGPLCVTMADELAAYAGGGAALARREAEAGLLEKEYFRLAEELSRRRHEAAAALTRAVAAELPALKLEGARFIADIRSSRDAAAASGIDEAEFKVATNPGTPAGPLMKIASGGELSRFMLALKVCLADRGSAPTLVFDEIDSGIGGAVADAIGNRLRKLADKVQVLAVTHAPQVAAKAARHFVIAKEAQASGNGGEKRILTRVLLANDDGRREEIARMLAGATVTEEARAAAERLIRQSAA
jgi:DNA repair protein RecN (Recombination protein N)